MGVGDLGVDPDFNTSATMSPLTALGERHQPAKMKFKYLQLEKNQPRPDFLALHSLTLYHYNI